GGIAVRFGGAGGFDELVNDVLGRRHVRVAHAEVDGVLAPCTRLRLEAVNFLEDVGRQPLDAVEVGLHCSGTVNSTRSSASRPQHRGNKVVPSMALQPFLRLTLEEYLGPAVARLTLRHGLVI